MDPQTTLFSKIDENIYQELKQAIELGRWLSGSTVTEQQKQLALQAIIRFEQLHLPEEEHTAYIFKPEHEPCDSASSSEEQIIKFK
jgi:uncharacterized protein YeaC (DUF1315 family)